ncbi:MAG: YwiC-like family protein [Candidatus Didemnitutus sp.]|nr:YwiC-like family protein [Candidatus Didemnitutus sp.]
MSTSSSSFRSLVLPKEHGSWSLAFEPVVLGLLVAATPAGFALAASVGAGFFVRRPLKLAVTLAADDPRRGAAALWAAIFSVVALGALVGAATLGSWSALWPLLLCAPLGATFLWFDLRNEMREAEAELAGSAAFALVPAAFATLAGWSAAPAFALAALMLTRSLPTVLTVRCYLRLEKHLPAQPFAAAAAAIAAIAALSPLALNGWLPPVGLGVAALLAVRTLIFVSPARPHWTAKRVGMLEGGIGLVFLVGLAFAYRGTVGVF